MAGTDESEIIVASIALVVSLIAFGATFMQCLQQYLASARGYSQCNEKVMGRWAKEKRRAFSLDELRYEVQFEAPVIFLCPPSNDKKPVKDAELYKLVGTDKSLSEGWTTFSMNQRDGLEEIWQDGMDDLTTLLEKKKVHTSDNERASWMVLLSAVQWMELESKLWHQRQFYYPKEQPPEDGSTFARYDLPSDPPKLEDAHTLVVAMQRKEKSWDTIPANISRPYATTTMCHLVELLAALGIYWKEFNRKNDRYRAEGNGFMVLGERVSDLGLMFTFQVNGLWSFGKKRVIPVDEIKELCFGWVPTIYRSIEDKRRLCIPIDLEDLSTLQMATRGEIAETLIMIGCNNNTVKLYQEDGHRTSHLFPFSFELLGMLCKTLHIKDGYFTYIPNPTPDRWDIRSVSLIGMLESFQSLLLQSRSDSERNKTIVNRLKRHIRNICDCKGEGNVQVLRRFRALHDALEDADEILTRRKKVPRNSPPPTPITDQPGLSPKETDDQKARRRKVQDVLRLHIQEVLMLLNEPGEQYTATAKLAVPQWERTRSRSHSPALHRARDRSKFRPSINDVDTAGPDDRQLELMRLYFKSIRRTVVEKASRADDRRASLTSPTEHSRRASLMIASGPERRASGASSNSAHSAQSPTAAPTGDGRLSPLLVPPRANGTVPRGDADTKLDNASDVNTDDEDVAAKMSLVDEPAYYDDIWCTLVFRMICWLMLHDFNKLDVQVPKSELLGSRMPVYVA